MGFFCKFDLKKAYDHINWELLDYIIERFGFGVKWRRWMNSCIRSVSFSVLVDGSLVGFFGGLVV